MVDLTKTKTYVYRGRLRKHVCANPFFDGSKYVHIKIFLGDDDFLYKTVRFDEILDDASFLDLIEKAIKTILYFNNIPSRYFTGYSIEDIVT